MATEIINITVYGSTGAIDASLSPIISIYNLSRSAFDVNSAVVPYNATILSYQYFFTDYNPLYEYIANVDFGVTALTRYASFGVGTQIIQQSSGGGSVIDVTKKHEEIIAKYEKLMKEELQKIVSGINLDVSPILSAIARIPITNLSDISLGITVIQGQIKSMHSSITKDYITQRERIQTQYANEIDTKNSLLKENEYNLKEKESKIADMENKVSELEKSIEEDTKIKEEEMKIMDEAYQEQIFLSEDKINQLTK